MEMPNVDNVILDRERNIHYHVLAYRRLTPSEMSAAVRVCLAQKKGRLKKNSTVTIVSLIGHDE